MPPRPFLVVHALVPHRGVGEDRLAVHEVPDGHLVVVVADGAGGMSGGAAAAELVLQVVEARLHEPSFDVLDARSWAELLDRADLVIERDRLAGETTAVVVAISDEGRIVGAFAGDSEAWIISADHVDILTVKATSRTRLGSGKACAIPFEREKLDGTLLVASDGLFTFASPAVILSLVSGKAPDEALDVLLQELRLRPGRCAREPRGHATTCKLARVKRCGPSWGRHRALTAYIGRAKAPMFFCFHAVTAGGPDPPDPSRCYTSGEITPRSRHLADDLAVVLVRATGMVQRALHGNFERERTHRSHQIAWAHRGFVRTTRPSIR
jgi:serine/threonine protein phosphatase PrpC